MEQDGGVRYSEMGPVYHSSFPYQSGSGSIGSFLGGLFRMIRPLLLSSARKLGRVALNTGGTILTDISQRQPGERISGIVRKRVGESIRKTMSGGGKKKRKTMSKPRRKVKRSLKTKTMVNRPQSRSGRRPVKIGSRAKRDIFSENGLR